MKKFLLPFLLLLLMGMTMKPVLAETVVLNDGLGNGITKKEGISQEEIDRRMQIVFDYLNEHANDEEIFYGQDSMTFDIPVDEDVIVNAIISNQEQLDSGFINLQSFGSSTYTIMANTTYNYTLTLNNVVGSGDSTVYTVNYRVGNPISSGSTVYYLTINSVSINGTPPSGYSSGNKNTWIGNTNGNILVDTGGYITYTRTLLPNKTLNFNKVSFGSMTGSKLQVDYWYSVN